MAAALMLFAGAAVIRAIQPDNFYIMLLPLVKRHHKMAISMTSLAQPRKKEK
jgi:hypothetical protein